MLTEVRKERNRASARAYHHRRKAEDGEVYLAAMRRRSAEWRKRKREEIGETAWREYRNGLSSRSRDRRRERMGDEAFRAEQTARARAGRAKKPTRDRDARRRARHAKVLALLDRQAGRCGLCGLYVTPDDTAIDHVVPRSKGGSDSMDNLQATHYKCNMQKGNKQ